MKSRFVALLAAALASGCADPPVTERAYWEGEFVLSANLSAEQITGFADAADEWHRATNGRANFRVTRIAHAPEVEPWQRWTVAEAERPGRTLATARDCAIAFDNDREWPQELAYRVSLHEIGHVLGLEHAGQPGDLMYRQTHRAIVGVDAPALEALGLPTDTAAR